MSVAFVETRNGLSRCHVERILSHGVWIALPHGDLTPASPTEFRLIFAGVDPQSTMAARCELVKFMGATVFARVTAWEAT